MTDLDALERVAKERLRHGGIHNGSREQFEAQVAYRAAASPSAVLALVREVRELRERCGNLAAQLRTRPWQGGGPL